MLQVINNKSLAVFLSPYSAKTLLICAHMIVSQKVVGVKEIKAARLPDAQ